MSKTREFNADPEETVVLSTEETVELIRSGVWPKESFLELYHTLKAKLGDKIHETTAGQVYLILFAN